jgi:hypothetical protein
MVISTTWGMPTEEVNLSWGGHRPRRSWMSPLRCSSCSEEDKGSLKAVTAATTKTMAEDVPTAIRTLQWLHSLH